MADFVPATVTQVSPLKIAMHSDPNNPIPALKLATYAPAAQDVVRVQTRRSGLLPIVQGKLG